jgi:hypothetical protein
VLIVGLGLLLRGLALNSEFWLDEIWSWQLAHSVSSPVQLFTAVRHDNNHHLNSLVLWCWPAGLPWAWYRLHSLAAGLAAIVLAAQVGGRRGRSAGLFAAVLIACCYWLVLCSAEARGYALAVAFALLGFLALDRVLEDAKPQAAEKMWRFVFGVAVVGGFLSHLTFLHAYAGFLIWSLRHFARRRRYPGQELLELARLHALPAVLVGLFYLVSVRGLEVGGGPPASTTAVLGRLLTLGLARPGFFWLEIVCGLFALLVVTRGIWRLWREGNDQYLFFLVTVVACPAAFLIRRPPFLFERYFLIPFVFFLILLAQELGEGAKPQAAKWQRALVLGVLALVAGCNVWNVADFVRAGRGRLFEALTYIERHDPSPVIALTGDQDRGSDFRTRTCCTFYFPYLHSPKDVVYRSHQDLPPTGAGWLIVQRQDDQPAPQEVVHQAAGHAKRLAAA